MPDCRKPQDCALQQVVLLFTPVLHRKADRIRQHNGSLSKPLLGLVLLRAAFSHEHSREVSALKPIYPQSALVTSTRDGV